MRFEEEVTMIPIWGDRIPGNTGESKLKYLHPNHDLTMQDIFQTKGGIWDKSSDEITNTEADDTMVWRDEIESGYGRETMDDVPFLVPYIVPGSRKAVISCPGGAYLSKSVVAEGSDIAGFLNAAGISCFVLWYRTQPYRQPYMFLDLQRAIRYVRYHAEEYGIDPEQISTIGFSAGGNLAGVAAVNYGNKPVDVPGYTPDEIDAVDGRADAVALCYPAISLEHDKAFSVLIGLDAYNDHAKRKEEGEKLDVLLNLHKDVPPMFICTCADDAVVPPAKDAELAARAIELGIDCECHIFPYGGHGFGACVTRESGMPFPAPDFSAVESWKQLYVNWLNHTFAG